MKMRMGALFLVLGLFHSEVAKSAKKAGEKHEKKHPLGAFLLPINGIAMLKNFRYSVAPSRRTICTVFDDSPCSENFLARL